MFDDLFGVPLLPSMTVPDMLILEDDMLESRRESPTASAPTVTLTALQFRYLVSILWDAADTVLLQNLHLARIVLMQIGGAILWKNDQRANRGRLMSVTNSSCCRFCSCS